MTWETAHALAAETPDFFRWATQFGAAGLIGAMWIVERRQGALRERQLTEAHERIREQRVQLEQLVRVLTDNTKALSALEECQRRLCALLERAQSAAARSGEAA